MKNNFKFFLTLFLVIFLAGCSFSLDKKEIKKVLPADSEQEKDVMSGVSETQEYKIKNLNDVVVAMNGKTVLDLEKEMYDFYKAEKPKEEKLLSYLNEVDFLGGCQTETAKYLSANSGLSNSPDLYIVETPLFSYGSTQIDFEQNLSILFTLKKYRECLIDNVDLPKSKPAKFYYYSSLAKSLAGSFIEGSVFSFNKKESPDGCSKVADSEKKDFCEKFNEQENIDYLKNYYNISGVISAMRALVVGGEYEDFKKSSDMPTTTDEYLRRKMANNANLVLFSRQLHGGSEAPEFDKNTISPVERMEDIFLKMYSEENN